VSVPILAVEAVDQVLDEAAIQHLDFDPTCQLGIGTVVFGVLVSVTRCERPSAFESLCLVCSVRSFVCTEHHDLALAAPVTMCGRCRPVLPAADLMAYTPIRGV